MKRPPTDPSVSAEPHLSGSRHAPDPSEEKAVRHLAGNRIDESELAEQSVFDDPSYTGLVPEGAHTYWHWIEKKSAQTGLLQSYGITLLVALAAGPWAVLGAIFQGSTVDFYGVPYLVGICVVAPVVEEMMKVGAALYILETRPFYFRGSFQILLCAFMGGLVFGVLENLIYLHVYLEDPSDFLIRWRWMVCTTLHTSCSTLAGFGLVRVWKDHRDRRRKPDLPLGFPFLSAAMVLHGSYNFLVSFLVISGIEF